MARLASTVSKTMPDRSRRKVDPPTTTGSNSNGQLPSMAAHRPAVSCPPQRSQDFYICLALKALTCFQINEKRTIFGTSHFQYNPTLSISFKAKDRQRGNPPRSEQQVQTDQLCCILSQWLPQDGIAFKNFVFNCLCVFLIWLWVW